VELGQLPGMDKPAFGRIISYNAPAQRVHYREAGNVEWLVFVDDIGVRPNGDLVNHQSMLKQVGPYRAGKSYAERFAAAVATPGVNLAESTRAGDTLQVLVPPCMDQDGNMCLAFDSDAAFTKVFRDGKLIGESDFEAGATLVEGVPAALGKFRVESSLTRSTLQLASKVDATWTFSSRANGDKRELLPLRAVQFLPAVDARNAVARYPRSVLPLKVLQQPGAQLPAVKSVEVQVSGDGGKTWQRAAVLRKPDGTYNSLFTTPKGAKLISLKSLITDTAGNTSTQTVINAYRLR